MKLKDRVAIVTGGAKGIGAETARTFTREGATVMIWDVAEGPHDPGIACRRVDVTDAAEVRSAVAELLAEHGRVDVLVNNAGIVRDAQLVKVRDGELIGEMSEADFADVLAVNLKAVFTCTQAVAPVMVRQGYGRILNAASVVALYGNFGQTNYAASKAGVIGMTRVWSRELGPKGITVNAVVPGFIRTDMVRSMPEHVLSGVVERTPLRRMGEPRDVALAYLFLASEDASFVNGAVLRVDGGLVLGT
ncbi:MAG: SDR family oxidoreductase [Thermoleophilaceae bacterium]